MHTVVSKGSTTFSYACQHLCFALSALTRSAHIAVSDTVLQCNHYICWVLHCSLTKLILRTKEYVQWVWQPLPANLMAVLSPSTPLHDYKPCPPISLTKDTVVALVSDPDPVTRSYIEKRRRWEGLGPRLHVLSYPGPLVFKSTGARAHSRACFRIGLGWFNPPNLL